MMGNFNKNTSGFTLIETVVIVGVLGIIMISVTGILVNSFKAKGRIEVADLVEHDGGVALRELRENVIVASSVGISCAVNVGEVGSTLSLININDGQITNLVCYEGSKIASESASGSFDLTSTGVKVTGCNNFARCQLFPDSTDRMDLVNFSFTLEAGNTGSSGIEFQSRSFNSTVIPRN